MSEVDKEAAAISAVISALAGLDEPSCQRVLEYAIKRFASGSHTPSLTSNREESAPSPALALPSSSTSQRVHDIKALKDEKLPANSIQMAVLVAYYLKELAPIDERKDFIGTPDVTKYFNQARFQLPTGKNGAGDTLSNAKKSGYLETAGTGLFKLTAVGHNLAAYNMPTKKTGR